MTRALASSDTAKPDIAQLDGAPLTFRQAHAG
jgi:hypothetical protein